MAILFVTKNTLTAQNDLNHSVYLELGVVQVYSLNTLIFLNFNSFKVGARAGLQLLKEDMKGRRWIILCLNDHFMYAFNQKHHIELGLGTQIASYEIQVLFRKLRSVLFVRRRHLEMLHWVIVFKTQKVAHVQSFLQSIFLPRWCLFQIRHWAGISVGFTFMKKKKKNNYMKRLTFNFLLGWLHYH